MSRYLDTKFQYYPSDIRSVKPLGNISLYDYLYKIKNPTDETVNLFKQIEEASSIGDLKLKAELKAKTYYFTPCIYSDGLGRSYSNIKSWTGLMIIDIDGLTPEYAIEFKEYLFNNYKFFISVFLSASKRGVKGLVKIPICYSTDEFKAYFYGLMDKFQEYKGIDFSSKNCILANYFTYDRDLLYRLDAVEWNQKGIQIDEFKVFEGEVQSLESITEEDVEQVKLILKRMFNKIQDSGHLIVRSASLLGGGFSSAGYMNIDEMKGYLFDLIDATDYLQKSPRIYKNTCIQMVNKGYQSPVYLNSKDEE
jgi:hypothetical protein